MTLLGPVQTTTLVVVMILDGPFSKLDAQHRQNVINTIPSYAPQVILFSKDDINGCFGEKGLEHVWTIYSSHI